MKSIIILAALTVQIALSARGGSPETVFDTFGPNLSYNSNQFGMSTWNVDSKGSPANVAYGLAFSFLVPANDYRLGAATLAVGYLQDKNNLAISVVADNGGKPTGQVLETLVTHPANLTELYQVATYPSSLSPVLAAGSTYWLVFEPIDFNTVNREDNSAHAWYASSSSGAGGMRYFNFTAGNWDDWQITPSTLLPAFRIEGTLIPEPATIWLLFGSGLGWLGYRGWRRRA